MNQQEYKSNGISILNEIIDEAKKKKNILNSLSYKEFKYDSDSLNSELADILKDCQEALLKVSEIGMNKDEDILGGTNEH